MDQKILTLSDGGLNTIITPLFEFCSNKLVARKEETTEKSNFLKHIWNICSLFLILWRLLRVSFIAYYLCNFFSDWIIQNKILTSNMIICLVISLKKIKNSGTNYWK